MVRKVSIIALVAGLISFGSVVFAQNANQLPNTNKTEKEITKVKGNEISPKRQMPKDFKPPMMMPRQIKNALELLKYADELQLTDEQLIQLRAYYKKYFSEESKKKEKIKVPSIEEFCTMNEQELQKYAEEESDRAKKRIMLNIQKIIDIKKILTPEQFKKIKNDVDKEAELAKKRFAEKFALLNNKPPKRLKPSKQNKCKCHHMKGMKHFNPFMGMPYMQPMFPPQGCPNMMPHKQPMFPPQGMMQPHMQPMFPPQGCPNMMPHKQPMFPPQGMMQPHMQPMFPPQGCPNMMPHKQPMFPPQGMMQPHMQPVFPPQGCSCMRPHKKPMGSKSHKFHDDKNMNNPYMFKPPFMGCRDRSKMEPPFAGFLSKFFGCKKDKDSDIMRKEDKVDGAKKVPQKDI